jgi:hypothetical protein
MQPDRGRHRGGSLSLLHARKRNHTHLFKDVMRQPPAISLHT